MRKKTGKYAPLQQLRYSHSIQGGALAFGPVESSAGTPKARPSSANVITKKQALMHAKVGSTKKKAKRHATTSCFVWFLYNSKLPFCVGTTTLQRFLLRDGLLVCCTAREGTLTKNLKKVALKINRTPDTRTTVFYPDNKQEQQKTRQARGVIS